MLKQALNYRLITPAIVLNFEFLPFTVIKRTSGEALQSSAGSESRCLNQELKPLDFLEF